MTALTFVENVIVVLIRACVLGPPAARNSQDPLTDVNNPNASVFVFQCVKTHPTNENQLEEEEEPKKVRFDYDLFLHLDGHPPVNHLRCEKLTFNKPTEEFCRKLLKAGGVSEKEREREREGGGVTDRGLTADDWKDPGEQSFVLRPHRPGVGVRGGGFPLFPSNQTAHSLTEHSPPHQFRPSITAETPAVLGQLSCAVIAFDSAGLQLCCAAVLWTTGRVSAVMVMQEGVSSLFRQHLKPPAPHGSPVTPTFADPKKSKPSSQGSKVARDPQTSPSSVSTSSKVTLERERERERERALSKGSKAILLNGFIAVLRYGQRMGGVGVRVGGGGMKCHRPSVMLPSATGQNHMYPHPHPNTYTHTTLSSSTLCWLLSWKPECGILNEGVHSTEIPCPAALHSNPSVSAPLISHLTDQQRNHHGLRPRGTDLSSPLHSQSDMSRSTLTTSSSNGSGSLAKPLKPAKEHKDRPFKDSREPKSAFKAQTRELYSKPPKDPSKKPKENQPLKDDRPKTGFKEPKVVSKEHRSEVVGHGAGAAGAQHNGKAPAKRSSSADAQDHMTKKRRRDSSVPSPQRHLVDKRPLKERRRPPAEQPRGNGGVADRAKTLSTLPPFQDLVDPNDSDSDENMSAKYEVSSTGQPITDPDSYGARDSLSQTPIAMGLGTAYHRPRLLWGKGVKLQSRKASATGVGHHGGVEFKTLAPHRPVLFFPMRARGCVRARVNGEGFLRCDLRPVKEEMPRAQDRGS
ncbi:hypothetical protein JZ751_029786 [Albula glossodonta]|uniref:Protein naked cuticle homolog n=1 Tax=Albula glossodonta TaxID=121402 RepID=A0A8T2NHL7_9TELE|nr:hypothetical protein JZ751_029786 [Albula glossodonta]